MRYLIITAPTFEAGLSSFITHKSAQGFTVDVFNTTTTGTTTTAIKSFIQARYDNAATQTGICFACWRCSAYSILDWNRRRKLQIQI